MIFWRSLLALVGLIALQVIARGNSFELNNDMETCTELCDNCGGTAGFQDNVCQCHVQDDDQRGAECIDRIERQAEGLGLDVVSCDLASGETDRTTRCIVSPFRRFRNRDDADLIAKYFMNSPLGDLSSLLGSKGSKTEEKDASSASGNVAAANGDKKEVSGDSSGSSNSQMVGASNPMMGTQYADFSPLLGVGPSWLQPQPVLALENGFQGMGTYSGSAGFSGAQNSNSERMNYVGSSQPKSWNYLYNEYPSESMLSMSPYSYFSRVPDSVLYQGMNQGALYPYGYNPSLTSTNYVGLYPYPPPEEESYSQLKDPAPLLENSLDESVKTNEGFVEGSNDSEQNLGAERDAALEHGANGSENIKGNEETPVLKSMSTADNTEADAAPQEEMKEPSLGHSKSKIKRRYSKLKSKASMKEQ